MPHLILDGSANLHESNTTLEKLLLECHYILVEKLPTDLSNCKSRLCLHDVYVVGDNLNNQAFLHLQIKLLKGRSQELLMKVAHLIKVKMDEICWRSHKHLQLSVSVEIVELSEVYVK